MTDLKQKYDAPTAAVMRQALNEVVTDKIEAINCSAAWVSSWHETVIAMPPPFVRCRW